MNNLARTKDSVVFEKTDFVFLLRYGRSLFFSFGRHMGVQGFF